ncbi:Branched-chain amino acid ABC transporter, ATP-binding protein LivF (TC 3.A.1.4.1) [Olavius sp. associated proteobacterium Delta 1]|nr:Branched-chain amino acid ABC transporter, ATP-binding protein LivF (TC 3.A.1.4.1) [Olavius sp. associated proteobacterium Delta 1]
MLGGNACGKSTTMKTILGLVRPRQGEIEFLGQRIEKLSPSAIVRAGISPVLEARRLFPYLTVYENLRMGAYVRKDKKEILEDIERMYDLFPVVKDRYRQLASTLSGGEQQMVAMARALMARPKLLIMDEPSMGLSPLFVDKIFEIIQQINQTRGVSILLVEQNANMALSIASRGYVLQTGEIVLYDTARKLLNNPQMQKAYLGVA